MMLYILKNRTYRHLFAAQIIALLGTGLATVALSLLAFSIAGKEAAGSVLGTALAIKMIAYVGIAPVAGALAEILMRDGRYETECDSTHASLDLWSIAKTDLMGYVQKMAQRERLRKLGLDDVLDFCFTLDSSSIVPVLKEDKLIPIAL